MTAYYNEIDRYAAQWLRNLIAAGHIAPGEVDERSICDVRPDDLRGYKQCHFFAGIGGWSRALRLAGWPDDRPVWTGSCPCQPFSGAGKKGGGNDKRHLWPVWFRLIQECGADTVFGEQVEGAVGFGWLDRVFADMEDENHACGAAVLGAHSVRAPHIRQRLWWVAQSASERREMALQHDRSGRTSGSFGHKQMSVEATAHLAGWPTPRAVDGDKGLRTPEGCAKEMARKGRLDDLPSTVTHGLWPTPTMADGSRGVGTIRPHDTGIPLPQRVAQTVAMWLTATKADSWTPSTMESAQREWDHSNLRGVAAVAMWATPTVQDASNTAGPSQWNRNSKPLNVEVVAHGPTASGSPEPTARPGALNPAFVCWLMGYSAEWDDCAPTVTQSSRKSPPSSLKPI